MSIKLNVSNSLDSLVHDLGEKLRAGIGNVFAPHYIVTQTEGMNVWLKHKLAQQLGIVANIEFRKPADLIFKLYLLLGGHFLDTLSRESLVWLLYQLLGEPDFSRRFPLQAAYFNTAGLERDQKRMGLAEKLADLFDQYQIFRPEMIKEWNEWGLDHPELEWQSFLWIKAKALSVNELPDKTIVSDFILEQLKDPQKAARLRQQLPGVYLFGLSIVTRYHMDLYAALAKATDVHFYLLNPAPDIYWMDDRNEKDVVLWVQRGIPGADSNLIGNPLLTAWGKVLQNTFRLLFRNEDIINNYDTTGVEEPQPGSLLKKIQSDVFHNAVETRNPVYKEDLTDGSLVIQSCYTIAREVEALYHYLVHLVDQRKAVLSSRDIVVMVSDIDLYAPYIKAVFDNAPYVFRYRIADTAVAGGDNLLSALQAVLKLTEEQFTSENVMQLLDAGFIRRRFGLNDIDRLRGYVDAANIRFGIDGDPQLETDLVSWTYGLRRIMFGLCMSGGEAYSHDGDVFYPVDNAEGSEAWEVIRFVHFVEVLMASLRNRNHNRSIADWVRYVEQVVHDLIFLPDEEASQEEYAYLMEYLKEFNLVNDLLKETLSYDIFSRNLLGSIEVQTNSALFHNAGITFCSFIPMRSIPFKVVAMLGMDLLHFPRKEQALNFNLLNRKPMLGDRNIKDNDKHLFLETLLSAREYLYISYLGHSVKDNTELPASVLVDELLDYIQSGLEEEAEVRKIMIVHQPLQEFSRKYNGEDERLYRYADTRSSGRQELFTREKKEALPAGEDILLKDMVAFFKDAVRFFYNKRLGIYYNNTEITLNETELFELDALHQWQLKQQLMQSAAEPDIAQLREEWVRKGKLPLKQAGLSALQKIQDNITRFREAFRDEAGRQEPAQYPFSLSLGNDTLSGTLTGIYGGKYIYVCWSSSVLRHMIEVYLNVLAGVASGHIFSGVFIYGKESPVVLPMNLSEISQSSALFRLMELRDLFRQGLEHMIPFVEVLYREHKIVDLMDPVIVETLLQKAFDQYAGTGNDPYLWNAWSLGYFGSDAGLGAFREAYRLVVKPLFDLFGGHKF